MLAYGKGLLGKDYDVYFAWDDKEWYCSELVYKLYQRRANIELCALKPLKVYDLSHPYVKEIMQPRYGNNIPYDSLMVAPSDLWTSDLLVEVK